MPDFDRLFMALLSKAIRNGVYEGLKPDTDWEQLFKLSIEHDVTALLYELLKKTNIRMPDGMVQKWKNATLAFSIRQMRLIYEVEEAIKLLAEANIEVIVVKGLFFKELYPDSALRTMCDADILIHLEDFPAAVNILSKAGYSYESYNENVMSLVKKPFYSIDVHSNLIFEHAFKYAGSFLQPWDNAVLDNRVSGYAKTLSPEDCFIYTIVHMAKHLTYKGHGVRQLCDIVLFTEEYMDEIDWSNIIARLNKVELKNLTDTIFYICNKYLNMQIPSIWFYDNPDVGGIGDILAEYLMKCGVSGHGSEKHTKVFELRQNKKRMAVKSNFLSMAAYILGQFFPPYEGMKNMYGYLPKYPFLLPVAWLARSGKFFKNRKIYRQQLNDIISSRDDIDYEDRLHKALGLEKIFR